MDELVFIKCECENQCALGRCWVLTEVETCHWKVEKFCLPHVMDTRHKAMILPLILKYHHSDRKTIAFHLLRKSGSVSTLLVK